MSASTSIVFETYSAMADVYDADGNEDSCWGTDTARIVRSLAPQPYHRLVADIGCGTGVALRHLATGAPQAQVVGVEPSENMRRNAINVSRNLPNVRIAAGAFEEIPLEAGTVDYMVSINAFHWVADLDQSVREIVRVMSARGEQDHYFIGRNIGREFVRATTPIFLKYMGIKALIDAAKMRQIFTVESARSVFEQAFPQARIEVEERYDTYYDSVEGHLGWWVRIEPQLLAIPAEKREACYAEIRAALAMLDVGQGVPYTKHTIHVRVRPA